MRKNTRHFNSERTGSKTLLAELLMNLNVKLPVQMPDISTKEKAQKYLGLEMDKMYSSKLQFIKTILPQWDSIALRDRDFYINTIKQYH